MGFENQLLQFMAAPAYRPMKQHELAKALKVGTKGSRAEFRHDLYELERTGRVVRLRKNRWSLPDKDNRITGTIRMMPKGGALLIPETEGEPEIYISERNTGTALPNDKVAVEVFHSAYAARQRERQGGQEMRAEGRVVNVLERGTEQAVGVLRHTPYYSYVIPDAPGFREDVRIEDPLGIPENHKVLVKLAPWEDPYKPLHGSILEDLGSIDTPGVDIDSLLREAGIDEAFPEAVVREAHGITGEITPERMEGRHDLRDMVVFTIDPETARDYDDAVSLEEHPDGGWKLGVHIADVSAYVLPGSRIDKEALRRGNSIYLVDRAVMMLPPELTTRVCSLNPENDHLTHTVELQLSPEGEVLGTKTYPSVIHSRARLTYTQVQAFINGDRDHGIPGEVVQRLEGLWPVVQKIRERRTDGGSVEINTPEIEIKLNPQGRVEKMMPRSVSKEAYQLIEECMLLANRAVAEILIASGQPAVYRIHEEPDEEQWASMGMELQALGIPVLPQNRRDINQAVRLAQGSAVEYTANLAILRNFKRAEYSATQAGHFGLAFDDYTHFTSPIRRYPDLLVHRLLKSIERGERAVIPREEIESIALRCNDTERKADELERQSIERKRIEYYSEQLNNDSARTYRGYIVSVKNKGMIVELPDSLQRGMIPFSAITSDWLRASEDMTRALTRNGKVRFTIGDGIEVRLAKVDTARGFIDYLLAGRGEEPARRRRHPRIQPDMRTVQPRPKSVKRKRRRH
jgi:ribonuclease R